MRVLIAEYDRTTNRMLETMLSSWGYEVVPSVDGNEAWKALQRDDAPSLALVDWSMPKLDGVEVCRRVRQGSHSPLPYIILLIALNDQHKMIEGLQAGADDYLTKPFHVAELRARIQVGERVVGLHNALINRISQIKQLRAFFPSAQTARKFGMTTVIGTR